MLMKKLVLWVGILLLSFNLGFTTSITFTFAHGQITGTSPQYYEFDVMASAGASGTKLGDTQVYINYNTSGFGSNIVANGKVTVTKGALLKGDVLGSALYDIVNVVDNTPSRLSITNGYNFDSSPTWANDLLTTPDTLLHIKIEIANPSAGAGLSFEQLLMDGNQYESDNTTKYDPVIASDTDDASLPVVLSVFTATGSLNGVELKWITESEINNAGFEILRATKEAGTYQLIDSYLNNPDLQGQGNSSTRHIYYYKDELVTMGQTYWYKLIDIDYNGVRVIHGPVSATVQLQDSRITSIPTNTPRVFKLYPNFPNPFNPSTKLQFDIPALKGNVIDASLIIYNSLGQKVRELYSGQLIGGRYQTRWDGQTEAGTRAPSGIYFAVFRAGSYQQTIKLMLMK